MKTIHIKLSDCPIRILITNNEIENKWFKQLTGLCNAVVSSYRIPVDILKSHKKTAEVCKARRELCKLANDRDIPMYATAEFLGIDVGGVKHYLKEVL